MTDEIILKVENLGVEFNGFSVLEDINFTVEKGKVLAVVGPNGAGKSVMFRALLNLIPYSGSIQWKAGLKIGYVPQRLTVEYGMPLTVREFLKLRTDSLSNDKVLEALAAVGINTGEASEYHLEHHILNQQMGRLSGGQFQRVLIAWALIGHPDVLLFDEPTTGIDIGGEETIYNLLHELQDKNGLTLILISHDLNVVYRYADNVICINKQRICFGEPSLALDSTSIATLYGGETKFYHHDHSVHHGEK